MANQNTVNYFAETNYRNERRKFGIQRDDRRRHMYVIGKTGMGKSTLLENMIIQDVQNGEGLAVVDPHGDLVEKILEYIPSDRINDVVYFNPSDYDNPIAFNILEEVDPQYKHLVSNGLVGVFKKIWADSWGPRLEYILINTILALLEYPGSTLLGVMRMLVDGGFRKKVLKKISDPVVKSFWVNEFNNYTEKFRNEAIAPIQNKVGQFLSSSLIRNIVGQTQSSMDIREIMDGKKILLMNLSKGRIGEENAALLGAMMITKIQLAAMSRVDTPEEERQDFFLYVDEFQNFATESFAGILSEARKYRLSLIMAHQYIEQLSDEVRAAVFGNVGTMVTFRVGATDAEELEKEYSPTFVQEDIVTLPAYHIYLRLMINGVASDPFSASTLPPLSGKTENRDKVIRVSRERYANPRDKVEDAIASWANPSSGQTEAVEARDGKKDDNGRGRDKKNGKNDRKKDKSRDKDKDTGNNRKGKDKRDNKKEKDNSDSADQPQERPAVPSPPPVPVPQPVVDIHAMPAPPKPQQPVQVDSSQIPQPMEDAYEMRQQVGSAGNSINFVAQLQQKMNPEAVDTEQFSIPVPAPQAADAPAEQEKKQATESTNADEKETKQEKKEEEQKPQKSKESQKSEKSERSKKQKSEKKQEKRESKQEKKSDRKSEPKKKVQPAASPSVGNIAAALPSMPQPVSAASEQNTEPKAKTQPQKQKQKQQKNVEPAAQASEESQTEETIGSLQLPKPLRDKKKREAQTQRDAQNDSQKNTNNTDQPAADKPKKRKRRRKRKRKGSENSGNGGNADGNAGSNRNSGGGNQSAQQGTAQEQQKKQQSQKSEPAEQARKSASAPSFVNPTSTQSAPQPIPPAQPQPNPQQTGSPQPIQPGQRIQF